MKIRDIINLLERDGWYSASGVEAMKKYLIVIEETSTGFSAYSPDLPGCVSTGATRDEVEQNMHEAIEFHLDGCGQAVNPSPSRTRIPVT